MRLRLIANFVQCQGAVVLDRSNYRRVGQAIVDGNEIGRKTAHPFGKDLDIAFTAPFSIGNFIQTGALLQANGGFDSRIEQALGLLFGEFVGFAVQDYIP